MSKYICDASVLIAYFKQEKGWEKAEEFIANSIFCSVNFSEVIAKLEEVGYSVENLQGRYQVIDFNEEHAFLAGKLRSATRQYGLSLADRACLATAIVKKIPAVTADKDWLALKIKGLKIICIR